MLRGAIGKLRCPIGVIQPVNRRRGARRVSDEAKQHKKNGA